MNVSPAYMPYANISDLMSERPNKIYMSEIFIINQADNNGDHERYKDLMNRIHHPDSDLMPYDTKFVTKNWNKFGDLVIHVEYYKITEPPKKEEEF